MKVRITQASDIFNETETTVNEQDFYSFIKHLNNEHDSANGIIVDWNNPFVEDNEVDVSITIYDDYVE